MDFRTQVGGGLAEGCRSLWKADPQSAHSMNLFRGKRTLQEKYLAQVINAMDESIPAVNEISLVHVCMQKLVTVQTTTTTTVLVDVGAILSIPTLIC